MPIDDVLRKTEFKKITLKIEFLILNNPKNKFLKKVGGEGIKPVRTVKFILKMFLF